jgi:hypothetical protein
MTLCLVWQIRDEIFFLSDSRLTGGEKSVVSNDATKIFKVDVKIYLPLQHEDKTPFDEPTIDTSEPPLHYQSTFGLCFTGSYMNGSLFADTIEEVLSNIQICSLDDTSPIRSDYSIDNLSKLAFDIYQQVSRQLMQTNGSNGLSEILFGGYCPMNKCFKLYRFYPKPIISNETLQFDCEQINLEELNGKLFFLGDKDAKAKAATLMAKISKNYTCFHLLREVINDASVPTVGGNMQAGRFRFNEFKTMEIAENSMTEDEHGRHHVKTDLKFRGISINIDDIERNGNIIIIKNGFAPFEQERDELFKDVNKKIDEKRKASLNAALNKNNVS